MPLSITQEVENQYLLLSGHEGELPSRQARAIVKVMAEHIERQENHIRSIEERLIALQNLNYFADCYFKELMRQKISIDKEPEIG